MKTLKKSEDGTVMMVERSGGIAISVLAPVWGARGRSMFHEWQAKATGLSRATAETLFAALTKEATHA
jgi:hypothetical protein